LANVTRAAVFYGQQVTSGWIIGENLRPFIEVLGWQANTRLSDPEWEGLCSRLGPTDETEGRWAEYAMPGISLRYAWMDRESEGTYVSVEVAASDKVESAAETLISVMQAYRLQEDR
jgi:hypothetical protein